MFLDHVLAHEMVTEVGVILALLRTVVNLQLLQLVDLVYFLLKRFLAGCLDVGLGVLALLDLQSLLTQLG